MKKIICIILSLLFFFTLSCEVFKNSETNTNCIKNYNTNDNPENNEESFDKSLVIGSWYYEGTYDSETEITDNIITIESKVMVTEWIELNYIIFSEVEMSQHYWFDGVGVYSDTSFSYQYQIDSNEITFFKDSSNLGNLQVKHIENNSEHLILFNKEDLKYYLFNKSNNLSYLLDNTTVSSDYKYLDFLIF